MAFLLLAGMSVAEAAVVLEVSRASAFRDWTYAEAWLRADRPPDSPES